MSYELEKKKLRVIVKSNYLKNYIKAGQIFTPLDVLAEEVGKSHNKEAIGKVKTVLDTPPITINDQSTIDSVMSKQAADRERENRVMMGVQNAKQARKAVSNRLEQVNLSEIKPEEFYDKSKKGIFLFEKTKKGFKRIGSFPKAQDAAAFVNIRPESVNDLEYHPMFADIDVINEDYVPKNVRRLREYIVSNRLLDDAMNRKGITESTKNAYATKFLADFKKVVGGREKLTKGHKYSSEASPYIIVDFNETKGKGKGKEKLV